MKVKWMVDDGYGGKLRPMDIYIRPQIGFTLESQRNALI